MPALIIEMSCVEAWREFSELIDGTLDPEMHSRVQLHLQHCAHCKAVYEGTQNVVRLVGDDRAFDLPDGFSDRLFRLLSSAACG